MASVDEHGELDGPRSSHLAERIKSGTNRTAREQHVVDQDDDGVVDAAAGRSVRARPRAGRNPGRRGTS